MSIFRLMKSKSMYCSFPLQNGGKDIVRELLFSMVLLWNLCYDFLLLLYKVPASFNKINVKMIPRPTHLTT